MGAARADEREERANFFRTTADAARQWVGTGTGQEIIPREAVSDALANRLVEDDVLPGLDASMEKYGKLSEQEPSEERLSAAAPAQAATKAAAAQTDSQRAKE